MAILLSLAGVAYSQNLFAEAGPQGRGGQQQGGRFRGRRPGRGGGGLNRLMRHTMRGVIFVKGRDGKTQRLRIDRGKITSLSDKSMTIEEMDGHKVKIGINKDTKFIGKPLDELQTGDPVGAIRRRKSGHYRTLVIMSRRARPRGQKSNQAPPSGQNEPRPPLEGNSLGI